MLEGVKWLKDYYQISCNTDDKYWSWEVKNKLVNQYKYLYVVRQHLQKTALIKKTKQKKHWLNPWLSFIFYENILILVLAD